MLWVFSIYLEALAIVPQLITLQRYREVENLTGNYVFFLGAYRALYILNWVWRSYHEVHYKHNWIVYACGVVQTCLYVDFFYYFIQRCVLTIFIVSEIIRKLLDIQYLIHFYFIFSKYRGGKLALPK